MKAWENCVFLQRNSIRFGIDANDDRNTAE